MKKYITSLLLFMASAAIADDIRLGVPAYNGSGCQIGTVAVALSPDQKALSVLFNDYQVQSGRSVGRTSEYKNCNVAIPVHVPQGYSFSIFEIDYRGFNNLPGGGASSTFRADYFFAGSRGPSYANTFRGPLSDSYTLTNVLGATAVVWSRCGADVILRTNTSMFTKTNSSMQDTISTVDSIDLKAGIIYRIYWKRC